MSRLWLMVPVTLVCTLLFPPLGLMASGGGALYAHRTGNHFLRNVLMVCFLAVVGLSAWLRGRSGL